MKTQQDIQKEIETLKLVRPKLVPETDLKAFDAQIRVLEQDMNYPEIYAEYSRGRAPARVLSAALIARDWVVDDEAYTDGLAVNWPIKSILEKESCDVCPYFVGLLWDA